MAAWRDFPLPDGSYSDETRPFSQQDVVNYLPTIAERNGTRSPVLHKTAPGLKAFSWIGTGPHRGAHNCEGRRFIVSGRKLYQVDKDGVVTDRGAIPGTGRVTMAHNQIANGNQVLIGTIDNSYLWDTTTATLAATGIALQSVDFLNQRFLGVDQQRRFWRHSALADGTSWNDLDVYSSESSPDRIVGLKVLDGQVYVFNERTIEVFVDQPTETQVYQRSVVIQRGCISGDSIVRIAGTLFFVGDDYIPYRLDGYTPVPIGTKPIASDLSGTESRKLFGFGWEDRGYLVYYITAQDGHTWGYDVTNGRWHRRESYGFDRWRINTLTKFGQDWYAGDYSSGLMYKLEWGYVYEGCEIMPRKLRTGVLHNQGNRVRVHGFRLFAETGLESSTPVCIDPPVPPQSYLLVTGSGSPTDAFSDALSADPPEFALIASSTGANISGAIPAYYDAKWLAANSSGYRYSENNKASWSSGSLSLSGSIKHVVGGPDGWIIVASGSGSYVISPAGAPSFSSHSISASPYGGAPEALTEIGFIRYLPGAAKWFASGGATGLFGSILLSSDTLSATVWDNHSGTAPNGIAYFHDVIEFGGAMYASVTMSGGTYNAQVRRSDDGGLTWPTAVVQTTTAGGSRPYQLEATSSTLLVYCWGGQYVYTSADVFSEAHATGIASDKNGVSPPLEVIGRQVVSANDVFYIISGNYSITPSLGNKCVTTADGLTFRSPVSLPITSAKGIIAGLSA